VRTGVITLSPAETEEGQVAILERRGPIGYDIKFLNDTPGAYVVGRNAEIDVVIDGDDSISSRHAELERKGPGWYVSDLGSTNGTKLNGERITTKRALRDSDVIGLGRTTLTFRDPGSRKDSTTRRTNTDAPEITKTERLVLIELCRPAMSGRAIAAPASVETIGKALSVGAAAVRAHLGHLYDKFGTEEEDGKSRREVLANDVMERGIITPKDYE